MDSADQVSVSPSDWEAVSRLQAEVRRLQVTVVALEEDLARAWVNQILFPGSEPPVKPFLTRLMPEVPSPGASSRVPASVSQEFLDHLDSIAAADPPLFPPLPPGLSPPTVVTGDLLGTAGGEVNDYEHEEDRVGYAADDELEWYSEVRHDDDGSVGVFEEADVVEMSAKRRRMNIPELPWESGTVNLIFSKRSVLGERDWSCSGVLLLAAETDLSTFDEMPGVAPEELGRVAKVFAKKLMHMRAPASHEQVRAAALKRLKVIICLDPTATKLGVSLLDQMRNLCDDEVVVMSISDAFRSKASQTLIKRAGSLERFARWCFEERDLPSPFRASESHIYKYLCHLRESGAKPTSANHFLQAWRFALGALQLLRSPPSEVISTRCEGASRDQYLMKALLKQKSPLTRTQVERLEFKAVDDGDTWSDSQRIVSISRQEADGIVLLVVDALTAKHTYTQESQRTLLPYAALGKGLSGNDWASAWLHAREVEGLSLGREMCLPSLKSDGSGWLDVKMSSTEGQMFLQEFLCDVMAEGVPLSQLGTHSLAFTQSDSPELGPAVTDCDFQDVGTEVDGASLVGQA
ncbi:unnamed protein product [Symbiodinium sp. CCMP2592]|nr:unnamed protein product [Symbiodinium sp. CCMP2592]